MSMEVMPIGVPGGMTNDLIFALGLFFPGMGEEDDETYNGEG